MTMRCTEFLELYSDYRDGLIREPGTARMLHRHLRRCRQCMEYDALISRGVMALRATSDIDPSAPFQWVPILVRNQPRPPRKPARSRPVGIMAACLAAALIAFLLWTGLNQMPPSPSRAAPSEPIHQPNVFTTQAPPLVRLVDLNVPEFGGLSARAAQGEVPFVTWVTLSR